MISFLSEYNQKENKLPTTVPRLHFTFFLRCFVVSTSLDLEANNGLHTWKMYAHCHEKEGNKMPQTKPIRKYTVQVVLQRSQQGKTMKKSEREHNIVDNSRR